MLTASMSFVSSGISEPVATLTGCHALSVERVKKPQAATAHELTGSSHSNALGVMADEGYARAHTYH